VQGDRQTAVRARRGRGRAGRARERVPAAAAADRGRRGQFRRAARAVYALCFADPFAWMAADAVLLVPFLRNIMKNGLSLPERNNVGRNKKFLYAFLKNLKIRLAICAGICYLI